MRNGLETIAPDDLPGERRTLRRMLGWGGGGGGGGLAFELVASIVLHNRPVLVAFLIHGAMVGAFLQARRLAEGDGLAPAANLMGYALLVGTVAANVFVGAGTEIQILAPVLAVAMTLPYLAGRQLLLFLCCALVAQLIIVSQSEFAHEPLLLPEYIQGSLEVAAVLATFGVTVVVLRQFVLRLRRSVARADQAKRHATRVASENLALYREAAEAVRVRDDFLSVASHELRTPLTPLHLQLQSLLRELRRAHHGGDPPRDLLPRAQVLFGLVLRLEQLIDKLLDVSRMSAGPVAVQPERLDLVEVVTTAAAGLQPMLQRTRTELIITAPEHAWGTWDRLALDHIVSNLLSNAAKFGSGHPIEVRIQTGPERTQLIVRDQGIGIAPEDRARIFERFERAAPSDQFGGFGVGLWIVKQMVDAMDGSVAVRSELGRGSTFAVELPTQVARHAQPSAMDRGSTMPASRIL
jgi:signal transduction histidine kinase